MATSAAPASQQGAVRDHGFHPLRIRRVVHETAEAASFVFEVPADLRAAFAYEAGQFLTFRAPVGGETHHRCYSMSSSPAVDDELQVTVKRVPGGVVSNWMIDSLAAGDVVEASVPAGVFLPRARRRRPRGLQRAAAASPPCSPWSRARWPRPTGGCASTTPTATATRSSSPPSSTPSPNATPTASMWSTTSTSSGASSTPTRCGPSSAPARAASSTSAAPVPFMDIVEGVLLAHGVDADRIHIERFTPAEPPPDLGPAAGADGGSTTRVTVELGGRTDTVDHRPGTTILQTARQMGMSPPFSCESGTCATCMAKLVEGTCRDARQRRAGRRRGGGRLGADLPVRAHRAVGPRGLRGS